MKTPWRMPLFVYAVIGVSIVSCSGEKTGSKVHDDEHAAHWGYEADNGLVSTYRALGGGWQLRTGNSYVDPDTLNEMRERTDWGELLDN